MNLRMGSVATSWWAGLMIVALGLFGVAAAQPADDLPARSVPPGQVSAGVADQARFLATGCFPDAEGDVTNGQGGPSADVPRSDVVRWCASHAAGNLRVAVNLDAPTNPLVDPTWNAYGAAIVVFYTDAQGQARTLQMAKGRADDKFEYYVYRGENSELMCQGNASYASSTYTAVVPQSCVGSPTEISLQVSMFYGRDRDNSFATSARDYAPDLGFITLPQGQPGGASRIPRLAGPERLATAIEVSRGSFEDGAADAVVLASSETFPDALVAAPLAVTLGAPVLLTPQGTLPQSVLDEIDRVAGADAPVSVMGGVVAVSQDVEDSLVAAGHQVNRVAGNNRFETAVQAAQAANPDPTNILLTFGGEFGGALVSGAATTVLDGTVVLIDTGGIPPVVQEYLDSQPDALQFAVGDTAVDATPELDGAVIGASPSEISVEMAKIYGDVDSVTVASAEAFPDGLAGGAYAAARRTPLLLSPRDAMQDQVFQYLRDGEPWSDITFFGGVAALSDTVASQAASTLE